MNKEEQFTQNIKAHLDRSAEAIDPEVSSRITGIRNKALEQGGKKPFPRFFGLPAAGLAGAVAVLLVFTAVFKTPEPGAGIKVLEVVDILSSENGLELYEDLEFYSWLAETR